MSEIIGLDLSLTGTGFAKYDMNGLSTSLISTTPKDGSRIVRSISIAKEIRSRLHHPDLILIEDYAYNVKASSSTIVTLGELGGIVKAMLYVYTGREPLTIASTLVKKWLGSGSIKKEMMPVVAYRKLGIELKSHDEYVAAILVKIGRQLMNLDECTTKIEQEVITKIRKNHPMQTFAIKNLAEGKNA